MAIRLLNDAEAQASGTTVTNANTGDTNSTVLDAVAIGAGVTLTFDNTAPMHGTNAFKYALTAAATTVTYVGWSASVITPALPRVFGAFYFRTNTASITSSIRLVEFRKSGATVAFIGCVNANQGFQWRTSAAAVGTISGALSANTHYRCEFDLVCGGTGTGNLTHYVGDSAVAAGTGVSGAQAFGTDIDEVRFGFCTANFSSTIGDTIFLDSLNVNDTALPGPGPYTAAAAVIPTNTPSFNPIPFMR